MSHIHLENVSKVFDVSDAEANKALEMLAQGMSSAELREAHGYSVGLYDVSLSIEAGELHCIMGLSGSGKSTLVRHINRLIDPTHGKIWVDCVNEFEGEGIEQNGNLVNVLSLNDKQLQQYRQHNISMVFQHFGLVPHLTVIQNVAYGLRVRKMSKAERHDMARHWLHEVGLEGIETNYPDELSGGMQQRVGLARALAVDTPIILMDEAFSALDPLIRGQLQEQLLGLQDKLNKTIVFITHDIDEATKLGSRISILNGGRLVQTDTPTQLQNNPVDEYVAQFFSQHS